MSKKLNQTTDNENQTNGGQKNKENDGTITMVLKFNMHCNRCAEKVVKFVGSLHGVKSVTKKENDWKKITVVGSVDPVKLREILELKFNRNVKLIPHKQVKGENDHKQVNQFPVTTVVMKVSLNCQACIKKIQKLVGETEGFVEMSIDNSNNLVTVKGAMDMNVLAVVLKKKLKRRVEIVQVKSHDKKKEKGSSGDGEGKENGGQGPTVVKRQGDSGDRDRKESGGQGPTIVKRKGSVSDIEGKESGGRGPTVVHGKGGIVKKGTGGGGSVEPTVAGYNHRMEYFASRDQYTYPQSVNQPEYMFNYMHATQIFNDENPNACVVM